MTYEDNYTTAEHNLILFKTRLLQPVKLERAEDNQISIIKTTIKITSFRLREVNSKRMTHEWLKNYTNIISL